MAIVGKKIDQPAPSTQPMRSSLYVGDLDSKVSSMDLFHVFSKVGNVSSVHLCVDARTGESLRYGYVNFSSTHEASIALKSLNHANLRGKPMRVMWCQRDPYSRRAGVTNLFVKNLHPSITSATLQCMFEEFGTILSCKVVQDDDMKSKGFGFVHFEDGASASAAVVAMHNKMVGDKKLYVARFMSKSQRIAVNDESFTNLFVKNLDEELTDDVLKEKFSEFGTVSNAVIMRDAEGKSKGFGFISFESHDDAKKAAEALNGADFGSKKLFVSRTQTKAEREEIMKRERELHKILQDKEKSSNLYVKHLAPSVDDRALEEHFSPCGQILSAKVMRDDNGVSKGFGFVCFTSPSESRIALSSLQGSNLHGKCIFLNVAMKKQERQRALKSCNYFMPFSCQAAKLPLKLSPSHMTATSPQKAIPCGLIGSPISDSLANTKANTEFLNHAGVKHHLTTSFPLAFFHDLSYNHKGFGKLQSGSAECFDCC